MKELWSAIFYADYYQQVTMGVNKIMHRKQVTHEIYQPTEKHKKKLEVALPDNLRKKMIKDPFLLKGKY